MKEADIKVVADFLHRAVQLSLLLQKEAGSKHLKDFVRVTTVPIEGKSGHAQVKQLRSEVVAFANKWPLWCRCVDSTKAYWSALRVNRFA